MIGGGDAGGVAVAGGVVTGAVVVLLGAAGVVVVAAGAVVVGAGVVVGRSGGVGSVGRTGSDVVVVERSGTVVRDGSDVVATRFGLGALDAFASVEPNAPHAATTNIGRATVMERARLGI